MIITILTGKRPELLIRTIDSILDKCPGLLENNKVIVLNNAFDEETNQVLKQYYYFIDQLIVRKRTVSIGRAMSILAEAVKKSGEELYCHIEDDWECLNGDWVKQATSLIRSPEISQIRLRLNSEPVLSKHMITGEPIKWKNRGTFKIADKAHLTFNPSIIKVSDIDKIFPCTGERNAQKNWLKNDMGKVAQLIPGAFKHIGEDNSLRKITKPEL